MKTKYLPVFMFVFLASFAEITVTHAANPPSGREIHVSPQGDDDVNDGSAKSMLKTISAAAQLAQPGDTITVHTGVYRERVTPPRGGLAGDQRITYRAAPGEKVEIKGSEIVKGWKKVQNDTWQVVLPNSFFGKFNPYADLIRGDWFFPKDREHHTGCVYLDGVWLAEAAKQDEVLKPAGETWLWFAQVDKENTTIQAQFKGVDPNEHLTEINVRQSVFYPEKTGINYITVRGFTMRHAATNWAPPTAEQVGLVGVNWSKGWIIEDNVISHSVCTGVTLGKYGDEFDNKSANAAEGYVGTVHRALKNGWSRENIGHHVVRNNDISYCEQAGIVGSLGAVFSIVSGNTIHDIHMRRLFSGAEMAGIKFHAAIDTQILHNHIYRCCLGVWLDWMTQGTRVGSNLFHDNDDVDIFFEVNHGPFLVENNLFLSATPSCTVSQGGAFVHNLFAGGTRILPYDGRMTPYHQAHSTELAGMHDNPRGDDRFYNNLFVKTADLTPYDDSKFPVCMQGNVFLQGAKPSKYETSPLVQKDFDPAIKLSQDNGEWYLEIAVDKNWQTAQPRSLVTTKLLGETAIAKLPFEHPDGKPLSLSTDYLGVSRPAENPSPGPFEIEKSGKQKIKVWPLK
jgi:alpha-N-arabinofuranosidase